MSSYEENFFYVARGGGRKKIKIGGYQYRLDGDFFTSGDDTKKKCVDYQKTSQDSAAANLCQVASFVKY
jgi:hypothetical protein